MIDSATNIELSECLTYADRAVSEQSLAEWEPGRRPPALIVPEGFEERSFGILLALAARGIRVPQILIGRYVKDEELNRRYRDRFECLAEVLAPRAWGVVDNHGDGLWIQEALERIHEPNVALDITGLSHRGLFGALDCLSSSTHNAVIMYSEAAEYWPRRQTWKALADGFHDADQLASQTDEGEWLYSGRGFHVDLIKGHEGYDVAGSSALVAFLPFKAGRLAAVMNHGEYSQYLFIAGKPRLPENTWRLEALKKINREMTKDGRVAEISTFGYRESMKELANLLFGADGLASRFDLHLAPMGSKLQTISCWALSRITRVVTMVTAIPGRYFPGRYSDGVGASWVFPLSRPDR